MGTVQASGRNITVTEKNAKAEIEKRMGDLVDLLALFVETDIDLRAWRQLLIYVPAELFVRVDPQ
jgi:hypothetical protein